MPDRKDPRVVIVGGGFAGIAAARELRNAQARVVVVDRVNHHLFQPLLYQVAGCMLADGDIASPIRELLSSQANTVVALAEVTGFDPVQRHIYLDRFPERPFRYDYLVLAAGVETGYFEHDEWARFAPGMKTLEEGIALRSRILEAFELAELHEVSAVPPDLITFVIVGGGPTGCELAGSFIGMFRETLVREFRRFDPARARVVLVEAGPRLLPSFAPELAEKAHRELERLGVEVRLNSLVESIDAGGVTVGGARIASRTVIWAAGVHGAGVCGLLGGERDRQGRIVVEPDLTVPGHPEIFVAGDAASIRQGNGTLPGVAPVAIQSGQYVGRSILRRLRGEPALPPFEYRDKGNMATIGRGFAIMESGRVRISGHFAKLAWAFLHIWYLMQNENRLIVFLKWTWHYFTRTRGTRLIERSGTPARDATARKDREP
ncbi:NAD(P)/FAD-dependent oxidoreductase [Geobacter sp. SVR]|uniref:NAD(P)/FAD-dependent oxidoreductase n=1 Tax=Geobacter sp. SVR TaxID=2495594 RepID=UPI00143EF4D6|nr:NAD(P)/FAD-dependent oxidoreductase [Geobacter sp. SVR]BCS52886.1 NADH dehydrogenase [Geobacter sp. SVR]GCF87508.1 NADH dehydrogenase [Geobacter sp. SVR]